MDAIAQLKSSLAGRYQIDREIGRGGMATVYLARDVRHNRRVALKVLNPELGAVLGVERFLSEIQVTANLQHPNLLPLFDSGEAEGLLFYVMPYVEGESLRAKLQREKQLPIDDALHIGTAVASALDYAHRHGVIHRDLKPENILLHEGQPVVADFGIALAVSNAGGNRITQTGLSLGTPHYMSPEQATGDREIDGRTDVYSLGAVVYEMLAGEPPHDGKTSQAIIAKVLTDKPRSLRLGRDTIPAHVEGAVDRALAKLPADRFHSAQEFATALNGRAVLGPAPSHPTNDVTSVSRSRRGTWFGWIPWGVAVVGLAMAALGWGTRAKPPTSDVLRYEVRLPPNATLAAGVGNPVAVSAGGRHIAYAAIAEDGSRRLHLKAANELRPHEVPGSENARNAFFSPDGEWVAFYTAGQMKKAAVRGGGAVLLTDVPGASRATWSPSGVLVMPRGGVLAKASAAGGAFRPFTVLDSSRGETLQGSPLALADGETILYTSWAMGGATAARIGVASLKDGSSTILDVQGSYALGVLDGYLIYGTVSGTIMAVPFDLKRRQVTGTPVPVVDQVGADASGENFADLSPDGALVYVSGSNRRQLVQVVPGGASRPVIAESRNFIWPRVSPNGRRIALTIGSSSRTDIWVYDLPSGPLVRLTTEGTTNDRPEWMPDGKSVVFRSNRGPLNALWIQPVDGAGSARPFFSMPSSKIDEGVISSDGAYLAFQRDTTGIGDLWYKGLRGDTAPRPIDTTRAAELSPRFSPDGRWIAYQSQESGSYQVYVRSFPSLSTRHQVSLDGGITPVWSRDGKRIYYAAGRRIMMATVTTSPQSFSVVARQPILERMFTFNTIHADFDVLADGSIIALRPSEEDAQLVGVHNWMSEFRARMKGAR